MLRYLTAGESHGETLAVIIEGLPAGLPSPEETVNFHLRRRQKGYGRGGRMAIETDTVRIVSGLRNGHTIGAPLCLLIPNRDWENWKDRQTPPLTVPRPGHADLAGALKYGLQDIRDVLERASARETAARTAVGAVCQALLLPFGIRFYSHVRRIGPVAVETPQEVVIRRYAEIEESDFRCLEHLEECRAAVDQALSAGDSLGGIVEVIVTGCPVGLGSHVHWDRKLDAAIAAAVLSVQSVKGVEFGSGFALAGLPGSAVHDEILHDDRRGFHRRTNHAGGIEGGMTNGEPVVFRAAVKPIPTLMRPLRSADLLTGQAATTFKERADVCAVPAAAVVCENVAAFEIARAFLEAFGADSFDRIKDRFAREAVRPVPP